MLGVDREYAMAKVKKQRSAMKTCKELKIDNILPKIGKNDKYDDYDGVVRFDNLFSEAENNRYYALVDEVDKASASDPEGKDENTAVAIAYLAKEEERRMNRMRGFISSVYQRVGDWEEQNKNNNVTNPGKVYAILNIIDEELASPSYKDLEGNLPASFSSSDEALDLAAEYADPLGDQRRKEALERRKDYDEDVKNTAMARAKKHPFEKRKPRWAYPSASTTSDARWTPQTRCLIPMKSPISPCLKEARAGESPSSSGTETSQRKWKCAKWKSRTPHSHSPPWWIWACIQTTP